MDITVETAAEHLAHQPPAPPGAPGPAGSSSPDLAGAPTSAADGERPEGLGALERSSASPGAVFAGDLRRLAGVVVVSVTGEIDLYTAPRVRERLQALLATAPGERTEQVAGLAAASLEEAVSRERGSLTAAAESHSPVRVLVIDLLKVSFMDSYALGVLVWAHKTARARGVLTALVADNPMHHKLFQITGLSRVMPLQPDLVTALQTMKG